ncbi:MAG: hypothetical protein JWO18_310 [Microbacteriaceae bacterium]|jgi:hypothetical protein|nr:hypothetical protein [Microbacteriaceae bacterium]
MTSASADQPDLAELVGSLGLSSLLIDEYALRSCGMDALAYGRRGNLIDARTAIHISLERMRDGVSLTEEERRIALALRDEEPRVLDELQEWGLTPDSATKAECFWQYCTFSALLRNWERRDFPEADFLELLSGWDVPSTWQPPKGTTLGYGSRRRSRAWLEGMVAFERDALCT